ncbi:MAG: FadR family transcriptional regulator [Spirochaetales bacterium]|nr:FadR family transcriptional regulator [Spirochaetales bacterium]
MTVSKQTYEPLQVKSLKEEFIDRFEHLILSGEFEIGRKLPPERELARQLKVSRPVIHEGLLELASRGLVSIVPRKGTYINDYRSEGSLELLVSLVNYHEGRIDRKILSSILAMRVLFESETAYLAAQHRSKEDLTALEEILKEESVCTPGVPETVALVDYSFHHRIALASGNMIYPLLMNSFRVLYLDILGQFYRDPSVIDPIFQMHRDIVESIRQKNGEASRNGMRTLLTFSENNLYRILGMEKETHEIRT